MSYFSADVGPFTIHQTAGGGSGTVRRVERLQNGVWRADWRSGLVSLYATDPRPAFRVGREPGAVAHRVPGTPRVV